MMTSDAFNPLAQETPETLEVSPNTQHPIASHEKANPQDKQERLELWIDLFDSFRHDDPPHAVSTPVVDMFGASLTQPLQQEQKKEPTHLEESSTKEVTASKDAPPQTTLFAEDDIPTHAVEAILPQVTDFRTHAEPLFPVVEERSDTSISEQEDALSIESTSVEPVSSSEIFTPIAVLPTHEETSHTAVIAISTTTEAHEASIPHEINLEDTETPPVAFNVSETVNTLGATLNLSTPAVEPSSETQASSSVAVEAHEDPVTLTDDASSWVTTAHEVQQEPLSIEFSMQEALTLESKTPSEVVPPIDTSLTLQNPEPIETFEPTVSWEADSFATSAAFPSLETSSDVLPENVSETSAIIMPSESHEASSVQVESPNVTAIEPSGIQPEQDTQLSTVPQDTTEARSLEETASHDLINHWDMPDTFSLDISSSWEVETSSYEDQPPTEASSAHLPE
ncbi:MAG: hypothetical protein ACKO37_09585, partial [Vampirovibrionales bacterium]